MNSPLGVQRFLLNVVTTGTPHGFAHSTQGRVPLQELAIDGDTASFVIAVDKPVKLATTWRVSATGSSLRGTVKAGMFPAMKVVGVRTNGDDRSTASGSASKTAPEHAPLARSDVRVSTAAVLRAGDGEFTLERIALQPPAAHQVRVRIVSAGICHTDTVARSIWHEPVILGHEGAGIVEEVGEAVTSLLPGDHVVLSFASCGTCRGCRSGQPYHCAQFDTMNFSAHDPDGGVSAHTSEGAPVANRWFGQSSFAGHCLVAERDAVKVDPTAPLPLLGPLGCGILTGASAVMNVMCLRPGQRVAVFGVGAVGLAAVLAARTSGASEIVVVDTNSTRRTLALDLGADRAVDPAEQPDVASAVLAQGPAFDYSFDTTARTEVMTAAVDVLTRPGLCVFVGAGFDALTVTPAALAGKTITYAYMGNASPQVLIPRLIALWQRGDFPFDKLLTAYPFNQINTAERDAASGAAVKPVLTMPATLTASNP